jgi:hypothetical protein
LQSCRRITRGRSGIREDTCGPAADATDDLRPAAGRRPSGGAVDSPPHDPSRDLPHVRLRLPRLYERGLAPESVKTATLRVYVVTTCLSNTGLFLCPSTAFVTESRCVVGAAPSFGTASRPRRGGPSNDLSAGQTSAGGRRRRRMGRYGAAALSLSVLCLGDHMKWATFKPSERVYVSTQSSDSTVFLKVSQFLYQK